MTIQTKDFEEYFSVGLFIMFYKVDATFVSGKRNLQCELESYWAVRIYFPVILFIMPYNVVLTIEFMDEP